MLRSMILTNRALILRKRPRSLIGLPTLFTASSSSSSASSAPTLSELLRNNLAATSIEEAAKSDVQEGKNKDATAAIPKKQHFKSSRVPSLVGGKVAKSKLKYMQDLVDRLDVHQLSDSLSPVELRTAYLYWLSYEVRNTVLPDSPIPIQNAVKIFQTVRRRLEQNPDTYAPIFATVFGNGSEFVQQRHPTDADNHQLAGGGAAATAVPVSPNLAICRLIGTLLQPLQGTSAAMKTVGKRYQTSTPVKEILECLVSATELSDFLRSIHTNYNQYLPQFQPDHMSFQTQLNLIAKRCKFLTFILGKPPYDVRGRFSPRLRRGISWTDETTILALGNCQRAKDCVDQAKELLNEMKQIGISMETIHHGIFVSILADASRHDDGMAERAFQYVQEQYKGSNDPLPTSVYNPVLLAHCREAERHFEKNNLEKVYSLCEQSERIMAMLLPTNDPITYSLMLKLYKDTHQPRKAQELLDRMYSTDCPPSGLHCNTVMDGYAKSGDAEAAVQLFHRMGDLTDAVSYTIVANAILGAAHIIDWKILETVLRLIEDQPQRQQQQQQNQSSTKMNQPDIVTYSAMFDNVYRRLIMAGSTEEKERLATLAEQLLWHVMKTSELFRDVVPKDDWHKFYSATMRCWAASRAPSALPRSLRLLEEMREAGVRPNGTTYQCILVGASGDGMIVVASDLLQTMEWEGVPRTATSTFAFIRILLDHVHENLANEGFELLGEFVAKRLAERIKAKVQLEDCFSVPWIFQGFNINLAKENDHQRKTTIARITEMTLQWFLRIIDESLLSPELTRCYNGCLQAWAFSLSPESTTHANRILEEMKERSIEPDDKTFEYALTCLSRNPDTRGVNTAREIFQAMNDRKINISLSMLNTFLRILVRSNCAGAYSEARKLLNEMESKHQLTKSIVAPNRTSYETLWRYSIQTKDCDGASEILNQMSKLGRPDTEPSIEMYLETVNAWSGSDRNDAMERATFCFDELAARVKPTSEMFLVLQLAWCHSSHVDAADRVEGILVRMQKDFDSGVNPFCRPILNNFRTVISALARSGQADKAEQVLVLLEQLSASPDMKDLAPNVGCYEDVMSGWLQSSDLNASAKAMTLLNRMRTSPTVLPNQQCYTHAINTLKKSININTADVAYELLCEMIELANSGRNKSAQPTHETFSAVLDVCASCFDDVIAIKAAKNAVRDYIKLHWPTPRRDVYLKYLHVAYMVSNTQSRDDAVLSVFTDPDFPCPMTILRAPVIREGLKQCLTMEGRRKVIDHLGIPIIRGDEFTVSLGEQEE